MPRSLCAAAQSVGSSSKPHESVRDCFHMSFDDATKLDTQNTSLYECASPLIFISSFRIEFRLSAATHHHQIPTLSLPAVAADRLQATSQCSAQRGRARAFPQVEGNCAVSVQHENRPVVTCTCIDLEQRLQRYARLQGLHQAQSLNRNA